MQTAHPNWSRKSSSLANFRPGVVKNFSGEVIRTFDADISASWDDEGVGTLDEVFRFNDGEVQTRVWTLTPPRRVIMPTQAMWLNPEPCAGA